jgi:hypothetical protein
MTETQTEIRDRWLAKKPLYEPHGNCAGCLPNGEPIDEEPEMCDGEHYVGLCNNCVDTAMELDRTYASKLMGFTLPESEETIDVAEIRQTIFRSLKRQETGE